MIRLPPSGAESLSALVVPPPPVVICAFLLDCDIAGLTAGATKG